MGPKDGRVKQAYSYYESCEPVFFGAPSMGAISWVKVPNTS